MYSKSKSGLWFFVVVLLIIAIMAFRFLLYRIDLNKHGVYLIGTVVDSTFNKSGRTFTFEYYFDSIKYSGSIKGVGLGLKLHDLVYVKTLPDNPEESLLRSKSARLFIIAG